MGEPQLESIYHSKHMNSNLKRFYPCLQVRKLNNESTLEDAALLLHHNIMDSNIANIIWIVKKVLSYNY